MEIVKRAIRLMHEGKCIYDQFQLDEDYNVPDAKEDVGNVIEGIVCVKTEEMKLVENYLKISGKAQIANVASISASDSLSGSATGSFRRKASI